MNVRVAKIPFGLCGVSQQGYEAAGWMCPAVQNRIPHCHFLVAA